jgi:hypothetical protein
MHGISSNNGNGYLSMVFMSWSESAYLVTLMIKLQQSEMLVLGNSRKQTHISGLTICLLHKITNLY